MSTELDDLKKRVAELEKAAKPAEPFVPGPRFQFDPTAGASMPPSAMLDLVKGVPESVMRGIRADAMKPNPVTEASSSPVRSTPAAQSQPQKRGSGWAPERPLESPPGVGLADRLMDHQDKIDKAELIERELKLKARMGKGDAG